VNERAGRAGAGLKQRDQQSLAAALVHIGRAQDQTQLSLPSIYPRQNDKRFASKQPRAKVVRRHADKVARERCKPGLLHISPSAMRAVLGAARLLPRLNYLNSEMANRMNLELCFSCSDARRDFAFSPCSIEPDAFPVSELGYG